VQRVAVSAIFADAIAAYSDANRDAEAPNDVLDESGKEFPAGT
jgi:hypothetical protein